MIHRGNTFIPVAIAAILVSSLNLFADGSSGSGTVSISPGALTVTQDFNTLANVGGPSASLPPGWYLTETGTGAAADGSYVVSDGSNNAGGAYSFGITGQTDRAIGSVGSGTVTPIRYGARFTNNTGAVITALTISYFGEMWRRGPAAVTDGLTFAYSTSQSTVSLSTGTFTDVPSLAFASPGAACATAAGNTDGNSAACRMSINFSILDVVIPDGQSFWIRWTDTDTTGSDDGVAVDDFSMTVTTSSAISIHPSASGSASPNPVLNEQSTTLSGMIATGQNPPSLSYTVTCNLTAIGGGDSQNLTVSGSTFSFNQIIGASVEPNFYSLPCTVRDDQARSAGFSISLRVAIPITGACGTPATPIHSIQGTGLLSPYAGLTVEIEGIVVADFQSASQLRGYYIEQPAGTWDADPETSEGIFVFNNMTQQVSAGDRVRLNGTVAEFQSSNNGVASNLTEFAPSSTAVCSSGNSLPPPVTLSLPVATVSEFERYEAMLVQIPQQLVVTGNSSLGGFGQIDLAPRVLYQPTSAAGNNATWGAAADLVARSILALDDASTLSNAGLGIAPYPAPGLSASNTLRVGALVNNNGGTVTPIFGILDHRFGSYRIQPTQPLTFSNTPNPRPDTAAVANAAGARFRLASGNVLNFFTTLGGRGAATAQELSNQRTKIIAELSKLNADVYGLSEVQNFANGNTSGVSYTNAAAGDLTSSLAAATGRNYQFLDTITASNVVGGDITQNGTDAIRNVIIYDASKLTTVGLAALYYQNDQNRPSLAQTFRPASGAKAAQQTFTVVVNHYRSKNTGCGAGDDPFQGGCNSMRVSMANAVKAWLATNPTADPAGGNRRLILIGDFNAYFGEDPIQTFLGAGGYTNLINVFIGANAYSYNFGSQAGYIDHALVNAAFLPLIKSVAEIHNNADEPAALQALNSALKSPAAQAAYFAPNEFAASDHDPVVIGFNPLAGDVNDDGVVDVADRDMIVVNYGKPAWAVDRRIDFDQDGIITQNDFATWFLLYLAFIQ